MASSAHLSTITSRGRRKRRARPSSDSPFRAKVLKTTRSPSVHFRSDCGRPTNATPTPTSEATRQPVRFRHLRNANAAVTSTWAGSWRCPAYSSESKVIPAHSRESKVIRGCPQGDRRPNCVRLLPGKNRQHRLFRSVAVEKDIGAVQGAGQCKNGRQLVRQLCHAIRLLLPAGDEPAALCRGNHDRLFRRRKPRPALKELRRRAAKMRGAENEMATDEHERA